MFTVNIFIFCADLFSLIIFVLIDFNALIHTQNSVFCRSSIQTHKTVGGDKLLEIIFTNNSIETWHTPQSERPSVPIMSEIKINNFTHYFTWLLKSHVFQEIIKSIIQIGLRCARDLKILISKRNFQMSHNNRSVKLKGTAQQWRTVCCCYTLYLKIYFILFYS
jgi:hypothetical protein